MTIPMRQPAGMVRPLRQCVLRCDSGLVRMDGGTYGYTRNGGTKFHGGVDLFAEPGTPCFAISRGSVVWAEEKKGWGKALLARVDSPQWPCWVLYAHLSEFLVKRGRLEPGMAIGMTGTTGNADAAYPHLHFEVWRELLAGRKHSYGTYRIDPLRLLGALPYQAHATEMLARGQQRMHTA